MECMTEKYTENRSVLSWLQSQERIVEFWIEEFFGVNPQETELIETLSIHKDWLTDRIAELTTSSQNCSSL